MIVSNFPSHAFSCSHVKKKTQKKTHVNKLLIQPNGMTNLSTSESWHKADRGRSREIVAKEGNQGRLWNTYIFSHRDV
jgi:hypothetical protein